MMRPMFAITAPQPNRLLFVVGAVAWLLTTFYLGAVLGMAALTGDLATAYMLPVGLGVATLAAIGYLSARRRLPEPGW